MRNACKSISTLRSLSRIASSSPSHRYTISSPGFLALASGPQNPAFLHPVAIESARSLRFSSESAVFDDPAVAEELPKPIGSDEIRAQLQLLDLALDEEAVDAVLGDLKCIQFVRQDGHIRFSSAAFNQMLRSLCSKGRSEEFWNVVTIMKRKGFGISKETYSDALNRFEEQKLLKDVNLLKQTFSKNTQINEVGKMASEICMVLGKEESSVVLSEKTIHLSSDLVATVSERISQYPKKALLFLRWFEGDPSFKMDGRAYNVAARVLGREDCMNEFQDMLRRIRNGGHQLEKETYFTVFERFIKRKNDLRSCGSL